MPLSDILSCPENQVSELIALQEPYSKGNWLMAKGIATIELSTLGELLGIDSYDSLYSQFSSVGNPSAEGPWPERIPNKLLDKISSLSNAEIKAVSEPWSKIDEFFGHVSPNDLEDYLGRVQEFIKANTGPFFLINSL